MLRTSMIALLLATIISSPSFAQDRREVPAYRTYGAPVSETHAKEIDALLASFKSAWGEQDTPALLSLHAGNTEWINAYARMFQGSEPLGRFLTDDLFPAFDPAVSIREMENMHSVSLRYLGDDAAVLHLYTDGDRGPSRNEGEVLRRTHIHLVLEKQSDGWRIVHTAIMDAR